MPLDSLFLRLLLMLGGSPEQTPAQAQTQPSGDVRTEVVQEWHDRGSATAARGVQRSRWERRAGYWWDVTLGRKIDAAWARATDAWPRRYGNKPQDARWIRAHEDLHWRIERVMTSGVA